MIWYFLMEILDLPVSVQIKKYYSIVTMNLFCWQSWNQQQKQLLYLPTGNILAAMNGEIILFDLEGEASPKKIVRKDMEIKPIDIKFSHNGEFLAIGGLNINNGLGYAFIWDRKNNAQYGPELMGFSAQVMTLNFQKMIFYLPPQVTIIHSKILGFESR